VNLDDDSESIPTRGGAGPTTARGRVLRYLLLGVLTALTAGGLASWIRSRSKTEHWQSAPTGWNAHTHEATAAPELVDVSGADPVDPVVDVDAAAGSTATPATPDSTDSTDRSDLPR
jgi:hypothetical protein